MGKIVILVTLSFFFVSCSSKKEEKESLPSFPVKMEYVSGNDTIIVVDSTSYNSYCIVTNREFGKNDAEILNDAIKKLGLKTYYSFFLYLKVYDKYNENDYYAHAHSWKIFPKATKEELYNRMMAELKGGITFKDIGSIIVFFDKIDRAKNFINDTS